MKNYLVYNSRENGRWVKKSKFIGYGHIANKEVEKKKQEFEVEIAVSTPSENLTKEQLLKIEQLKRAYNKKVNSLSKEEFERFEQSFSIELTYNSNAIEGSTLSLAETRLILSEGITPEGKTIREINEVKNHAEAIQFLKRYKGDINEEMILRLHSIILNSISQAFAGRYRETSVRIFGSDVKFPDARIVPQLVKNLVYWYKKNKSKLHPFELAVIFSIRLVSIHPFVDGNGRTSRLLMNFLLNKKMYPWINIYVKHRAGYLKAVRQANEGRYNPILEFCINSLEKNLKDFKILD